MSDRTLDLDSRRGLAAQKATDLRRAIAEIDNHARELRERQVAVEDQLLTTAATSWQEAAAKARYVLTLYAARLDADDTRNHDLVNAVLDDFARLGEQA